MSEPSEIAGIVRTTLLDVFPTHLRQSCVNSKGEGKAPVISAQDGSGNRHQDLADQETVKKFSVSEVRVAFVACRSRAERPRHRHR